jgi:hypothetical protein
MADHDIDRRAFLRRAGVFAAMGLGALALGGTGCGGGGSESACDDLSGLSAADKQTRVTYGYRNPTLIEAKRCDNCNFYTAPPAGQHCGSCTLVKGPIAPTGYCNSWAAPVPTDSTQVG